MGGKSGPLPRRFRGTPLDGRIFAKTGTVQGVIVSRIDQLDLDRFSPATCAAKRPGGSA